MGDHVTLRLREAWDSEASLRRHVCSSRFETLAGLLETALEPPRIEFALEGRTRGMDYVGEVRHDRGGGDILEMSRPSRVSASPFARDATRDR
jgi:hypothetical protein